MRNQMWLFGLLVWLFGLFMAFMFGWSGWELFKEAGIYYQLKEYGWVLGFLVNGGFGVFASYMSLLILWVMLSAWFKQMKEGEGKQ